jgi:MerR family copper efflux transcriptional regulator
LTLYYTPGIIVPPQRTRNMTQLTIGQVAKRTGMTVETIRFYEKQGLLGKPQRSASGYRQYPESEVKRIRFIQRAKDVGFTLKDIKELLLLRTQPDVSCADIQNKATAKIEDIEQKITDLQRMKNALAQLADQCTGEGALSECPILDALEDNEGVKQ